MKKLMLFVGMFVLCICGVTHSVSAATFPYDTVKKSVSYGRKESTKTIKLKTKSKKKIKSAKTTKQKEVKTSLSSDKRVETTKEIETQIDTLTTVAKGSKIKTIKTAVHTKTTTTVRTHFKGNIGIDKIAPKANANVRDAFKKLNFTVKVDPSVSYSGYTSIQNKNITVAYTDETIYHELGHFLAFVANNANKKESFIKIYNEEKNKYTGVDKKYVTQNASEYFAESYSDYVLHNSTLKNTRPKTYQAIKDALSLVNDAQTAKIISVYEAVWR